MTHMQIPIIIDTDPGVDDFFCLGIGLSYSDIFNLQGITTMGGNNYTSVTTRNALDIVDLFKKNTPVVSGSTSYLKNPFAKPVATFHGKNGLGNIEIPHSKQTPLKISVEDFIYITAQKYPQELTLVAIAPLTNLAKSFLKYPDLKNYLNRIVIMGGSVHGGNITPYAEANIGHDPYAAEIVFNSGVPIDMIGLDVTLRCPLNDHIFTSISTNLNKEIKDIMSDLIAFRKGEPMHDAVAIASLIDKQMLSYQNAYVTIETGNNAHKGQTLCDFTSNSPNCRIALNCSTNRFYSVLKGMCDRCN